MVPISLDAVAVVTERSKRTWQRRITDGTLGKLDPDAQGRTMVSLHDIAPSLAVTMAGEDLKYLAAADAGNAEAQADIAQLFLAAGKPAIAIYWLEQAVRQDDADAMQCLGQCYLSGQGVPVDSHLAMMWIAKAAAHGHVIARAQMDAMLGHVGVAPPMAQGSGTSQSPASRFMPRSFSVTPPPASSH